MTNEVLSSDEIEAYWANGYAFVENALTPHQLAAVLSDFAGWVEESREHSEPYGNTPANRPRFDLEVDHTAQRPALRRVASPVDVSDSYLEVMRDNRALDAVEQLIGPDVEYNNSKINAKHPGSATEVKYHQDFMFQPHTNDDLIAVLFFLDDVTLENGPLNVVPGTHVGDLFDHWHDGVYTGTVSPEVEAAHSADAVAVYGPAGSACLMHTRLLHGSAPNDSDKPRTLFICEYRAEDSKPLQVNHLPSVYEGEVVRGVRTNRVRCSAYEMEFPEVPTGASFFSQQAKAGGATK
ncbi:MAG: phytanoyl-CoA dioxygenase family protein [Acidimicrobiaceae bacterium]|nr:phytanoyl-CoA dioxygenase family protein [Acidimicrobiaceae bacterium]MYD07635.1 phytanoyl-CoA dioxygenase family protein [Acidimicrobiaceae bacterium]MYI59680.1 phytanoyl-CoA dioxygenase family protein [Acidimicrobiaceae bacterium]